MKEFPNKWPKDLNKFKYKGLIFNNFINGVGRYIENIYIKIEDNKFGKKMAESKFKYI